MSLAPIRDPALLTWARKQEARKARQCCWCAKPLGPGRRWWCGQECVADYQVRAHRTPPAGMILHRDQGVCALCGLDVYAAERRWDRAVRLLSIVRYGVERGDSWRHVRRLPNEDRQALWERLMPGWPDWRQLATRRWWEADHIVPVVRGGQDLGLANIRTLCVPCHRRETARLARERARERAILRAGGVVQEVMPL